MREVKVKLVKTVTEALQALSTEGFDIAAIEKEVPETYVADPSLTLYVKDPHLGDLLAVILNASHVQMIEDYYHEYLCNGGFWANMPHLNEHFKVEKHHLGQVFN